MNHLYYYLLNKNYTTKEAEKIIECLESELDLPEEVSKDINKYDELMRAANKNTLFDGVEI